MANEKLLNNILVDLLASFISTNGVKIQTGYKLSKKIVTAKLIHIEQNEESIKCREENEISDFLCKDNDYNRGDYVASLVAKRIKKSNHQINSLGGVKFLETLNNSNPEEISSLLMPLYGVGPKLIEDFCLLSQHS